MKNELKVGDILQGMWHYSMHYPVWFRIVSVSNKTAKAEELMSKMVRPTDGGYGQQGYEMPDENRIYSTGHISERGSRSSKQSAIKLAQGWVSRLIEDAEFKWNVITEVIK